MERLNKFLANAGICSRRKADEHILAGDVSVNGVKIVELGHKIDPSTDQVEFQGNPVKLNNDFVYYVLNKPKGVVSTSSDENGQKTVTDLVPKIPRVYPVGRLDKDTVGLIVLTNDGELTKELTHPSFEHQKEYEVEARIINFESRADKDLSSVISNKLTSGFKIDDKIMEADSVVVNEIRKNHIISMNLVLHTGYNRQIRKMCAKIGLEVTRLTRVGFAKLRLGALGLKPGEFKVILKTEII